MNKNTEEISKYIIPSVCNEEILKKHINTLKLFTIAIELSFELVRKLINSNDKDPKIIHKLKSTIGMLGYTEFQQQCIIVEKAINENNLSEEDWNKFRALGMTFLSSIIEVDYFSHLVQSKNDSIVSDQNPTIEDIPFLRNLYTFVSEYDGYSLDFINKNNYNSKIWFLDILKSVSDFDFELAKKQIVNLISKIEKTYEKK